MKLSISLVANKAAKPVGEARSLKRPAAFALGEEEEPVDAAFTSSADLKAGANKKHLAQNVKYSKARLKQMEAERRVDATVFEYDEVWDKMQEAKLRQKEAKEVDAKERKPKYIAGLLNSAATRKLDYLRAEEKMIQREREMEGDEFAGKESFVTQAYKDQLAEIRRAEEEERLRNEMEKRKKGGASSGMAHFYRKLLDESEQQHTETVVATQKPAIGPSLNLTITKPPNFTPKSDLELARAAREQGLEVELNDDNQIVDKRELLAPGLNLALPNTRRLGLQTKPAPIGAPEVQAHRAVGSAASRKEINERRAKEVLQQMEEEERRITEERLRAEEEATRRIVTRRNDEDAVQSARERYLQRKRQRLVEASEAAAQESLGQQPA